MKEQLAVIQGASATVYKVDSLAKVATVLHQWELKAAPQLEIPAFFPLARIVRKLDAGIIISH